MCLSPSFELFCCPYSWQLRMERKAQPSPASPPPPHWCPCKAVPEVDGDSGKRVKEKDRKKKEKRAQRRAKRMKALLASRLGSLRVFSTSSRQLKNKVPEYQKIFQEDNGLPVHLKGGTVDFLLYRFTMALTVFGAAYSVFELVRAAFPRKNK
ncbi:cytochrome c oxidase subunit 7A2, mitochondrial [Hemicordylus capensis]|uniref:cytochrome c oxidase subunit 7A2, mitochondrial n=1 Tax=Hemicordylus capensis TaxID=884348 RepID=UPI0023045EE1|nr:cytochrome c oxidase subunit 7A2, mitochondrial [Hemicordylus capensis]